MPDTFFFHRTEKTKESFPNLRLQTFLKLAELSHIIVFLLFPRGALLFWHRNHWVTFSEKLFLLLGDLPAIPALMELVTMTQNWSVSTYPRKSYSIQAWQIHILSSTNHLFIYICCFLNHLCSHFMDYLPECCPSTICFSYQMMSKHRSKIALTYLLVLSVMNNEHRIK